MSLETAQQILNILHTRIYDNRNKRYGWQPTSGQIKVGKALFVDAKKRLFIQCGRKWGKTEFVIYVLVRWAVMHANSTCAYFGPKRDQARRIIWKRLKTFIPREFLLDGSVDKAFKEQTLTVRLWNGSEIVLGGTMDEDDGRGVEPHIVVYDEYKDHKDGFREAMEANLEVYGAVEIFIGTPPGTTGHFTEMSEEVKSDPEGFFIEAPSWEGPVYGTEQGLLKIDKLKKKYERIGDLAFFWREYGGKFVRGGADAIFPMWDPEKHVTTNNNIIELIRKDKHKFNWFVITDPGSTSVHATLLAALNPNTQTWYILDEIYETDPKETTTRRIWPRIESLMRKWRPDLPISDFSWYKGYDEAAKWFALEVQDSYGDIGLTPTNKKLADKTNGLSLIKDQLIEKKVIINETCEKLAWEVSQYVKDSKGNIPKKNDHLIDIWRYMNSAAGYRFDPEGAVEDRFVKEGWRSVRPQDEFEVEDMFDDFEP